MVFALVMSISFGSIMAIGNLHESVRSSVGMFGWLVRGQANL